MKPSSPKTDLENHSPGGEPAKSHKRRLKSGLIEKYLPPGRILDIGAGQFSPVVPWATSVDRNYPGYDGTHLPFADGTIDGIFSSHCLEHVDDAQSAIRDWFRTLRVGAHLFIVVPHMYLYERKAKPPSRWNTENLRFFTPGRLLTLLEKTLPPNSYRVRLLADNDNRYDYASPFGEHPQGCYEIEMVVEKIDPPFWPDVWGDSLLDKLAAKQPGRLALCGAGQIGQSIYRLVTENGYQVACWTDRSKVGETIAGRTIQTLDDAFDNGCTDFIVTIVNGCKEIINEIKRRTVSAGIDVRTHLLADSDMEQIRSIPQTSSLKSNLRQGANPISFPNRPLAFVLTASNHGTMIVNRNDYNVHNDHSAYGVGYQIFKYSSFDISEISFALALLTLRRRYFGNGVFAIDGGANIGTHSVEWARHMHGWGRVLSFEAQEVIYYALAGNIVLNNCLNAQARLAALGEHNGELTVPRPNYFEHASFGSLELRRNEKTEYIGQNISYAPSAGMTVPMTNIDSLKLERVDLIKLDVEGMEVECLRGARETLLHFKPILSIEVSKSDQILIKETIGELGYRCFPAGINIIAVHADDPVLQHISLRDGTTFLD